MIAELTRRAHEEIGDDATPLDYAVLWVENGKTILALAEDLTRTMQTTIDRPQLSHYLNQQEEGETRLSAARARGAHALVEDAIAIADKPMDTKEEIAQAKLRTDVRTWIAERWNREELGTRNGPQINISVGNLHMDALRFRVVEEPEQMALTAPDVIADAIAEHVEILSDEVTTT